jgi:hypothetical protein
MYSVTIPQPKTRNGANYHQLLAVPTTTRLATATVNDKEKLVFHDSMFVIDLITNSWKYGSELQFNCYSKKPPTLEKRVDKDHEYYRLEVGYLPGDHSTVEKLREIADMIDTIICYSEPKIYVSHRSFNEKSNLAELLI